jgi:DNA primase
MDLHFSVLEPKITKEYLYSKGINQESIMQYYTGLDVSSKKLALSPFRQDKKVTCGFYKSKSGILYLHDFATNEHINCFEAVMQLYQCNYYEALNIIAKDFGLIKGDTSQIQKQKPKIVQTLKKTETTIIQCQIKEFSEDELNWWKSFGITKKLLKKYNVYSIKHVFLNGNLSFTSSSKTPIYGYYFGKDKNGIELWKIYFPFNKDHGIRFLNNLSQKKLQGYKQLDKSADILVITKSLKDCISLRLFGINAVAPSSESTFCTNEQIEEFKQRFKHILVIYDNDRPGKYNMAKIRREHPELNYYFLPRHLSKDFSDTIKQVGVDKMKELVNQFMFNYKFK